MTSKEGLAEIFGKSLLAEDMKAGEIEAFLALSRVRLASYDKGEVVFHDGDMPRCLYMLVEGEVHIQKDSFTGRRIFLSEIDEPGDVFGEVYLLLRKKYDMYVETVRETKLLVIDSEAFSLQETAGSRAVLLVQQNLMRVLARKAYFMHTKLKILASGSLRERIIRFLFWSMDAGGGCQIGYHQGNLGQLPGCSPSVSVEGAWCPSVGGHPAGGGQEDTGTGQDGV